MLTDDALLGRERSALAPGPVGRTWDLILLDRDGTLNRLRPGYVSDPDELDVLPGVPETLAELKRSGARIVVVTNQRGLATGALTEDQLTQVNRRLADEVSAAGGEIAGFHVCGHQEGECDCRKPAPGLIKQVIQRAPWARPDRIVLVGDSDRDEGAADAAGISFLRVRDSEKGLPEIFEDLLQIIGM